ncbi:hypothetical protein [Polaribacter sp.]|uniref:hypothetical protein n=1 Tax=Polaribacter sp. TaxID=1920175 RepID=UPI003F6C0B52
MNEATKKIIKDIRELAKTSDETEVEIMENINSYFNKRAVKTIVRLYKRRKANVLDLCKDYRVSTKKLYQILRENNVEIDRK